MDLILFFLSDWTPLWNDRSVYNIGLCVLPIEKKGKTDISVQNNLETKPQVSETEKGRRSRKK